MQRKKYIKIRSAFCKKAISNPQEAAQELKDIAIGLENCRNTNDTIYALCRIYAVSERTIYNDLKI